jgi:hypothetical protein
MVQADVLRAWWGARQGLDAGDRTAGPAEVLESVGWARSVGGACAYLTLHSRGRVGRADADACVAALAIHELPSARGCTYVVPASHFALALTMSQGTVGEIATLGRLGVPEAEIDALADAVVDALGDEQLDPAGLKDRLGDRVRNLGDEGKKRGVTTTLPAALGLLQTEGRIRRIPVDGRLDQQRYRYVRWDDGPLAAEAKPAEQARAELAALYWAWAGPATLGHFRWFSGLGAKVARDALSDLDLVAVEADIGGLDGLLALKADADALADFELPAAPNVELVASIDSMVLLRRDLSTCMVPADLGHPLLAAEKGSGGTLADLPHHAIVDRGRVIGLWDYDVDAGTVVWATFEPPTEAVRVAVAETEAFVREQLGDARSFSLDSPASRRGRLDALVRFAA